MLDYLKAKINDMEAKLRESQEKGLAFAYELKGREEARKESRREMEEFLAEVKRQQAESEAERSRGLELEKARTRIEALELKIMEFSAPRPEMPVPPKPGFHSASRGMEQDNSSLTPLSGVERSDTIQRSDRPPGPQETQLRAAEMEKLRAASKEDLAAEFELLGAKLADKILKETMELRAASREDLAAEFELLGAKLTDKILKETMEPLTARLAAESAARKKDLRDMRELAGSMADKVSSLENAFSKKLSGMETLFAGFSSQMASAAQAAADKNEEFRALAGTSFEGIAKAEAAMATESAKLISANEEFRSSLRDVSAGMEASRKETVGIVEDLKRALVAGGAQAADSAAGRLVSNSAPYDLGFITACFDNLEKALCAVVETLARTGTDARESADHPGADAVFVARRHAAILDSAARDLGLALEVFRGVRQEALKPIKKILGA